MGGSLGANGARRTRHVAYQADLSLGCPPHQGEMERRNRSGTEAFVFGALTGAHPVLRRNTSSECARRHISGHEGTRAHNSPVADVDIARHHRVRADDDTVAYDRDAGTRSTDRDPVRDPAILPDDRRPIDYDEAGVRETQTRSNKSRVRETDTSANLNRPAQHTHAQKSEATNAWRKTALAKSAAHAIVEQRPQLASSRDHHPGPWGLARPTKQGP